MGSSGDMLDVSSGRMVYRDRRPRVPPAKFVMVNYDLGQYIEHDTPGGVAVQYYSMITVGTWLPGVHTVSAPFSNRVNDVYRRFVRVCPPVRSKTEY